MRGLCGHLLGMGSTAGPFQPPSDGRARFRVRRAARTAEIREQDVQGTVRVLGLRRDEPVPRRHKAGLGFPERFALVVEDLQRQTGVQLRVVQLPAPEPAVLVVLHEMVIGVAGEGQRTET